MGTPVKPVVQFTSYLVTITTLLWGFTLVCDRLYSLHVIYTEEVSRLRDETWLRENCQDPVFYTNLRGHTDICTQVEGNARRNLPLFAVKQMLQNTYLCGTRPCVEQAAALAGWVMALSAPVLGLLAVAAVLCPVLLVQMIRVGVEALRPSFHHPGGFYSLPVQPPCEDGACVVPRRYPLYRLPCFEEESDWDATRKTV